MNNMKGERVNYRYCHISRIKASSSIEAEDVENSDILHGEKDFANMDN